MHIFSYVAEMFFFFFFTFYVRNDNIAEKYTLVEYDTAYMQSISLAVL